MSDHAQDKVDRLMHLQAQGVNGAAAQRIVKLEDEVEDLKSECSQLRTEFGMLALDVANMQTSAYRLVRVQMEDES
jgi:hypothetical protein